jgi:hypothetical protein
MNTAFAPRATSNYSAFKGASYLLPALLLLSLASTAQVPASNIAKTNVSNTFGPDQFINSSLSAAGGVSATLESCISPARAVLDDAEASDNGSMGATTVPAHFVDQRGPFGAAHDGAQLARVTGEPARVFLFSISVGTIISCAWSGELPCV